MVLHRTDLEVDVFVYLKRSGEMHVYMEPGIERNESTEDFYPCIDRHVKANINYFTNTCVLDDLKTDKEIYEKIKAFLRDNLRDMHFVCYDKKKYEIELFLKEKNGNMRNVSFDNPRCQEEYFQEDIFIETYSSVNSLIDALLDDDSIEKCNWRNLVKNPSLFAS